MKASSPFRLLYRYLIYASATVILIALARLMLYFFNATLFPSAGAGIIFQVFRGGLLFDFSTFCLVHLVFIPFFFVPYCLLQKKVFRIIRLTLLIIAGFVLLAPNVIDVIYFRFTLKRTTFDVFNFLGTIDNEIGGLSLRFLTDFWYMFLLFALLFSGYIFGVRKLLLAKKLQTFRLNYRLQLPVALVFTSVLLIGGRGSLNMRPLGILHASRVAGPEYAQLVVNSTYTIIKTYGKKDLEKKNWFSEDDLESVFSPVHYYYSDSARISKPNVVIIISESLSSEHCGFLNNGLQSFTPFLDSLSEHSLVFTNMFANGKRSLDGIPAIISSLPPLMQNPFVTSMYSSDEIEGVAKMLDRQGYSSAFFHGGFNGTMNFDGYAAAAGYEKYFGKDEYTGPESDFDGRWGIFDEPFLQFMSTQLSEFSQPFTACVFTLSAHHPYTIPSQYKGKFPTGPKPILQTVAYADYSLRKFFDAARRTEWFENTLFIITADHTSEIYSDCYTRAPNNHSIPMLWYFPADSSMTGKTDILCQQTDILPSLADYLNINDTIIAFGNSFFDNKARRFAIMMNDLMYQMITGNSLLISFDGEESFTQSTYYSCNNKSGEGNGQASIENDPEFIKALIQQFNNRAITNRLTKP